MYYVFRTLLENGCSRPGFDERKIAMKEKYIAEITHYVNAQEEEHIKCLAELTHIVDKNRLIYILTFIKKLFGSR